MIKNQFKRIMSLILCFSILFSNIAVYADTTNITPEDGTEVEWRIVDGSEVDKEAGRDYKVMFTKAPDYSYTTSTKPTDGNYTTIPEEYHYEDGVKPVPVYRTERERYVKEAGHYETEVYYVDVTEEYISGYKTVTDKAAYWEDVYENQTIKHLERAGYYTYPYSHTIPGYFKDEYVLNEDGGVDKIRVWVEPVKVYDKVWHPPVYAYEVKSVLVDRIYHAAETHREPIVETETHSVRKTRQVWVSTKYAYRNVQVFDHYDYVPDPDNPVKVIDSPEKYRVTEVYNWIMHPDTAIPMKTDQEILDESFESRLSQTSGSESLNNLLTEAAEKNVSSGIIQTIRIKRDAAIIEEQKVVDDYHRARYSSSLEVTDLETRLFEATTAGASADVLKLFTDRLAELELEQDRNIIINQINPNLNNLSKLMELKQDALDQGFSDIANDIQGHIDAYHQRQQDLVDADILSDLSSATSSSDINEVLIDAINREASDNVLNQIRAKLEGALQTEQNNLDNEYRNLLDSTDVIEELQSYYGQAINKKVSNNVLDLYVNKIAELEIERDRLDQVNTYKDQVDNMYLVAEIENFKNTIDLVTYYELENYIQNRIDERVNRESYLVAEFTSNKSDEDKLRNLLLIAQNEHFDTLASQINDELKILEQLQMSIEEFELLVDMTTDIDQLKTMKADIIDASLLDYINSRIYFLVINSIDETTTISELEMIYSDYSHVSTITDKIKSFGPYYYSFTDGLVVEKDYPMINSDALNVTEEDYITYLQSQDFTNNIESGEALTVPSDVFVNGMGDKSAPRYHELIYVINNDVVSVYNLNTLNYIDLYGDYCLESDYNSFLNRFSIYDFATGILNGVYNGIKDELSEVIDLGKMAYSALESIFSLTWDDVTGFVVDTVDAVQNFSFDFIGDLVDSVGTLITVIGDAIFGVSEKEVGIGIGYLLGSILTEKITGPLGTVVNAIGSASGSTTFTKVLNGLYSLIDGSVLDPLRDAISNVMGNVAKIFRKTPETAQDAVSNVITRALSKVDTVIDDLFDGDLLDTDKLRKLVDDVKLGNDDMSLEELSEVYEKIRARVPENADDLVDGYLDEMAEVYTERLSGCFVEGTLVLTKEGYKAIEEVVVGDQVLAYNQFTGDQAYKSVVRLLPSKTVSLYKIKTDNVIIEATADHPFYVKEKGFVKAENLTEADRIINSNGEVVKIVSIEYVKLDEIIDTYNFEVKDYHTYYVSRSNILVHNDCIPEGTSNLTANLLKKSTCTQDELYNYLLKNSNADDAKKFLDDGIWPEGTQIPKSSAALNPDGSIDWSKAPEGGYTLKPDGSPDKESFVPNMDTVIDRYGKPDGRYTSPVVDGNAYSYTERSLPYVEDLSSYHQYKVTGDFSRIEDYVNNCPDTDLKAKIDALVTQYYDGDYSKLSVYKGTAAKVDGWGSGGAIQYEFPLTVEQLEKIGLLEKLN